MISEAEKQDLEAGFLEITDLLQDIAAKSREHATLVASVSFQLAYCACRVADADFLKSAEKTERVMDERWSGAVKRTGQA